MSDADGPAAGGDPLVAGDLSEDGDSSPFDDPQELFATLQEFEGGHPATPLLRLLGRSQALAVLACLLSERQTWWRFTEMEEALDVSTNTLSKRLEELAEAGLVARESYDEVPPHVEYAATEKARDLRPVFRELRDWAWSHECEGTCPAR
jgi:DNA-binding HxlR family transcriptional regulator